VTTVPGRGAQAAHPAHRALWSWRRWALGMAAVGLLAVAVLAERPLLGESIHSFTHLRWLPLFWAVVAEIGSMISLALLERRILMLAGHRLSAGRAVAIAYASNAMAQSLPIVGSGAATAFTYRRMVSHGAEPTLAGWTLTLAGVASNIAFVVILSVGGLVSGETLAMVAGGVGLVLSALVIAVAVIAVRRAPVRERVGRAAIWVLSRVQRVIHRPAGDAAGVVGATMADLTAFHLHRRDAVHVVGSAFRNWAFDVLCLAFCIKATGAHVPWWGIVLAWAAGSGGASLNLTPGGLGVVEVALTGALVALRVPSTQALTAALVYRAISFWLAIVVGWPIYWRLSREHERAAAAPAETPADAPAEAPEQNL
jgi:putative heme transporter